MTQEELDYRSRQLNHEDEIGQMMLDNHSNQLNPNNSRYAYNDDDYYDDDMTDYYGDLDIDYFPCSEDY